MKRICIAIDGPASSGKGTLARLLAAELGFDYLDTGAMYRTIGWVARTRALDLHDAGRMAELAEQVDFRFGWEGRRMRIWADGTEVTNLIRTEEAGRAASDVAIHPPVRSALVARQRRLAAEGGVVMDGRDIGTVVLPGAELKIYLKASAEVRARRRYMEQGGPASGSSFDAVLQKIEARDSQDMGRTESPLSVAPDAVVIDSTDSTPDQLLQQVLALLEGRLANETETR